MNAVRCDFHSLPPKRRQVIEFIHDYLRVHERFPSNGEIAEHMGWRRPESAVAAMLMLVGDGFLTKTHSGRRWVFSTRQEAA